MPDLCWSTRARLGGGSAPAISKPNAKTGTSAGVLNWSLLRRRSGEEQADQGRSRPKNGVVQQG